MLCSDIVLCRLDVNCRDYMGRNALLLAVDTEGEVVEVSALGKMRGEFCPILQKLRILFPN